MVERVWKIFTGEYDKDFYDVRLPDGAIVEHCWPNAGYLCSIDGSGRMWDADTGVEFSLSLTHPVDKY